jgi:uncharacterized protein
LNQFFRLGYRLAFDTKTKKKAWEDVFALWLVAAKGGHKRAQFYLATCNDNGLGTAIDLPTAYQWYLKAAKQGHRESQFNFGFLFRDGIVVQQNYRKAMR